MRHLRIATAIACWLIAVAALPATATADIAADMGTDYGDVEPELQQALEEEVLDIFDESATWQWLPADEGFETLDNDLRGCFDEICLLEIAGHLDATLGVTIEADVTSDIYEWHIELYDLLEGESVAEDEGLCELCGHAEVVEEFRASLHGRLVTLEVDTDETDQTDEPPPEDLTDVRLGGLPDDTEIFVDGEHQATGPSTIELTDGTYEIELIGDDHDDVTDELTVDDNTPDPKVVRFHIAGDSPELHTTLARGDSIVDSLGSARVPVGWSTLLVGAGMTAGSFWLAGRHGQPACDDDVHIRQCPDVYNTATLATTTTIVGVLSMITGTTLLAWSSLTERPGPPAEADDEGLEETESDESSLRLSPSFGSDFSGVSIGGSF